VDTVAVVAEKSAVDQDPLKMVAQEEVQVFQDLQ
jgi:hypothetical protein